MTARTEEVGRESHFPAPPMLWAWVLFFLLFSVPNIPDLWDGARIAIDAGRQTSDSILWYPIASIEVLLVLAITLGLGLASIPHLRRLFVYRMYGLGPAAEQPPALNEIREFIERMVPNAVVTVNLRRARSLVFVYPEGWLTPGFAIFAGLLRIWRLDRLQAEAILMHEIEHARQRDFVLAGVGSPLRTVLRYIIPAYVVLFVIPTFVLALREALTSYRAMRETAGIANVSFELGDFLRHQVDNFSQIWVAGWMTQGLSTLALVLSLLVIPVAALWTMELNADRAAGSDPASRRRIIENLDVISASDGGGFRLLRYFVHPPGTLRIWMLRRDGSLSLIVLILLLPLSYLAALALLHAGAFVNWFQISLTGSVLTGDSTWQAVESALTSHGENFWTYTRYWLTEHRWRWALLGLLISSWPTSASIWHVQSGNAKVLSSPGVQGVSLIVGGAVLAVAALAFLLS